MAVAGVFAPPVHVYIFAYTDVFLRQRFCVYVTAIPYTVRVTTGPEKSMGTDSNVFIKIIGTRQRHTGRQPLELMQKKAFLPGSIDTFSLEAVDVGEVKQIEVEDKSSTGSRLHV